MATVTFGTTTTPPTGFPSHPALATGPGLLQYGQAIANAVSGIGRPTFLVNGSTVCKTATVTWDDTTSAFTITLT